MVVIRLRRTGSKKRPFFRLVVSDSRAARDGRFVEVLGFYNPRTNPETVRVDRERLDYWLRAGAQPSDTVRTLVARMPEPAEAAAPAQAEAPSTQAPAPAEQPMPEMDGATAAEQPAP